MKIAIFGGAFNPVHREHVNLVRAAVRELGLDKIIIMPTAVSPHKSGRPCADFWQRFEMCRIAFSSVPQAEIDNFELTRGGVSYTYLTCDHFASLYSGAERYLIIGADMLENFPRWKNPERILANYTLAACAREDIICFDSYKKTVEETFNTTVATIHYIGDKVSSTRVRTLAALGENFKGYVDEGVGRFIAHNSLYAMKNLWRVKDMVTPQRWAHTVRVAVMCAKNAARANISERQAITMAALHDCAKYLPPSSPYLIGFIPPEGVPDPVLHQYSGAFVAERQFGAEKLIVDAIRCHATGKEHMNDAEMLLYLSDLLEEGRRFPGVDELRAIFKKDLKKCMLAALGHQIAYLQSAGGQIDGTTLKAYESLKEEYNEQ